MDTAPAVDSHQGLARACRYDRVVNHKLTQTPLEAFSRVSACVLQLYANLRGLRPAVDSGCGLVADGRTGSPGTASLCRRLARLDQVCSRVLCLFAWWWRARVRPNHAACRKPSSLVQRSPAAMPLAERACAFAAVQDSRSKDVCQFAARACTQRFAASPRQSCTCSRAFSRWLHRRMASALLSWLGSQKAVKSAGG